MSRASRDSRMSRSTSYTTHRDIEFQNFMHEARADYPPWWTWARFCNWFKGLPDNAYWNCYICVAVLLGIFLLFYRELYYHLDVFYNISYGVHVLAIAYRLVLDQRDGHKLTYCSLSGLIWDVITFVHYNTKHIEIQMWLYYSRFHRPFRYLWTLNNYNLRGSIVGTTLKYCYIFMAIRLICVCFWISSSVLGGTPSSSETRRALHMLAYEQGDTATDEDPHTMNNHFLVTIYVINKMFIPIGYAKSPSVAPKNDVERLLCLLIMLTGSLVMTGAAVASLSLVVSLYMRPEGAFRDRYKLIVKDMSVSHVPLNMREKVKTFYKINWNKLRAVAATQLMATFPSTLPATVYTEIYFEATQKSRTLRDLSYQFISELAKKMQTVVYIPGDIIVKRSSMKSSVIYLTFGDIELLTAEDDSTAILRMTCGSMFGGCAACAVAACVPTHVTMRAATACVAHVLPAADLWRVVTKYGPHFDHGDIVLNSFYDHLDKVKRHYNQKVPVEAMYKSSILSFKRNLMSLKEAKDADGNLLLADADVFLEVAGCYIMRNRSDASLTDESDAICLQSTFPCILQPHSSLQDAWNFFTAIIIITVCVTHPYFLVYKKTVPTEFRFFDYVVTVIYVLDLLVHLSTGANVEEGVPITFAQTASQQMRSHWFMLDVVATLPIFEFIGTGHFAGLNKILRLPKVFRVLKALEDMLVFHGNMIRFLSYTLLLVIACYLIAALQQGFMCFQFGHCLVTNFSHHPYWEHKPLDEETVANRLTFGLYWAISLITFTSHMETWHPFNWSYILYSLFVLEICMVLRIFMEAVYSATIMVTTDLREDYDSSIANVKHFFIRNQVDPVLRQRFISYLHLCWYTDKAYSMTTKKSSIFYDLPPHVYQDIVAQHRSKYILCIPVMAYLRKEDLKNLSCKAKLFYTSPNEILMNTGDIINEMYIVKQGICEILCPETKKVIGTVTARGHIGVLACILRLPAFYTVRAVTHVQIVSLSRKDLKPLTHVPQVKDAIGFVKKQPEYARLLQHRPAIVTYTPPAPTPNMVRFRLPRKHEKDYNFLRPFDALGVFSVLRYIFPRYTIRPDGQYLVCYEGFRTACALASAMVFPSYTYLVLQWPWLQVVAALLDISAYFDILQRMLVGYFNEHGILVCHPVSTASHYLRGAFITDLFSCLALENLESPSMETIGSEDRFLITNVKQFLMLNRLLQLYRLPGSLKFLRNYIDRRDILLVIHAVPLLLALLNVFTCFLVFYSVNIYYSAKGWYIEPLNDDGGSWINLFHDVFHFNITSSPWNLHLACYFWVVYETTTTGYNVFSPTNFQIMNTLFCGMVIATMMITYFSVRIISIRANVNKVLASFQDHMEDIIVYMKREKLNENLQKEVFDYYEHNWDKMGGIDYRNVLKLCNQITLRTDAILHIYGPTFAKCPILSRCDVALLRLVGRAVSSVHFLHGMHIVECDDVIEDMYILDRGSVDVIEDDHGIHTIVKLMRGSIFGNLEGTPTTRIPATMVANTKVHILKIKSKAFHDIVNDFPAVRQLLTLHKQSKKPYIEGHVSQVQSMPNIAAKPTITMRYTKGKIKHFYYRDKFVHFYLIVVSLACIYLDVYNAGFQVNSPQIIRALYALDMAFVLKIFFQYALLRVVPVENAKRVLLPIWRAYLKGEFKYDIISCVPIEVVCVFVTHNKWMMFSLLRLNRMFRIVTIHNALSRRQEQITSNLTLSTAFSVLIWFSVFIHSATSLWYFLGVMEDRAEPNSSWIHRDTGKSWCNDTYICSLYFILTTFTQNGVGDIIPRKQSEVIFVSILQLISTMVYMIYVGELSNIIQYQSFRSFNFYTKYLDLQEFMKINSLSRNLVNIVKMYSLHLWRESRGKQVPHFLTTAPLCLKLHIMSAAYLHHLTEHPVFGGCEPAFLRQLVGCLQLYKYNPGMYVVKENEITDAMYLIHTGKVQESCKDDEVPQIYPAGTYFGETQGLQYNTPYTRSYRTTVKADILSLHLNDWDYLLKHFPLSKSAIYKGLRPSNDGDINGGGQDGAKLSRPDSKVSVSILKTPRGSTQTSPRPSFETDISQRDKTSSVLSPKRGTSDSHDSVSSRQVQQLDDKPIQSHSQPQIATVSESSNGLKTVEDTTKKHSAGDFLNKVASKAKKIVRRIGPQISNDEDNSDEEYFESSSAPIQQTEAQTQIKDTSNEDISDSNKYQTKINSDDYNLHKSKTDQSNENESNNEKEKDSNVLNMADGTKNIELPSTSKITKRYARVRYEDDEVAGPSRDIDKYDMVERNLKLLDSGNMNPELENTDVPSSTSPKSTAQRASKDKRQQREHDNNNDPNDD